MVFVGFGLWLYGNCVYERFYGVSVAGAGLVVDFSCVYGKIGIITIDIFRYVCYNEK